MAMTSQQRRWIGGVVLVALGAVAWTLMARHGDAGTERATFVARRGSLTISVTESGTIQSRDKVVVRNQVEGRTAIVSLVEEGTRVNEGDLLVELDASAFNEKRLEQEIRVQNAEAALIRARETLEITRNQGEADVDKARLDLRFAELDLEKYEKGDYPMELQKAEARITLAREELKKAEDDLAWSSKLAEEGYITRSELLSDELAVKRKQLDVKTAEDALRVLTTYQHGRDLEERRSNVRQSTMALERVERRARADLVKNEVEVRANESEFKRETSKLEKTMEQIAQCRITAPAAGMVVYATSGGRSRWHSNQPLEVGQEVSQRQELIHLPTTSAMNAEVEIPESALSKISEGLPARVSVDARPGLVVEGTLSRIAVLPDAAHAWLNPDIKVYHCEVELAGDVPGLLPGMSCKVEIEVKQLAEAVYVPVQAAVRRGEGHVVYVVEDGSPEPREVTLGMDNNIMVHVVDGLSAGEAVWLSPPLAKPMKTDAPVAAPAAKPEAERSSRVKEPRRP